MGGSWCQRGRRHRRPLHLWEGCLRAADWPGRGPT